MAKFCMLEYSRVVYSYVPNPVSISFLILLKLIYVSNSDPALAAVLLRLAGAVLLAGESSLIMLASASLLFVLACAEIADVITHVKFLSIASGDLEF